MVCGEWVMPPRDLLVFVNNDDAGFRVDLSCFKQLGRRPRLLRLRLEGGVKRRAL
jgi:hypothetical protein